MTTDRFFSVDGDGTFETHATADEALTSAINAIDWLRDNSDGIDESEIARCMWGVVLGRGTTTITQTAEQATADGDEDAVQLMRRHGWDYLVECGAEADCPALRDVIAEREKQRAKWGDAHDDGHATGDLSHAAAVMCADERDDIHAPEWACELYNKQADDVTREQATRKRLVIAAALLLAEIERLDRAAATTPTPPTEG